MGSMPICGQDNRLKGMITDRDIVVEGLANGKDADSTKASELGGKRVTIGADDSISEALSTMADHKVRRLPVIDGHDLIGVVSIADLASNRGRRPRSARRDDLGFVVRQTRDVGYRTGRDCIRAVASTLLFSATPFLLIPAFLLLVVGAIVWFAGREKTEPAPDPVTGGPRWWQKRWDE